MRKEKEFRALLLAVCIFLCSCAPRGGDPAGQAEEDAGQDVEIVSDQAEEVREESEKTYPEKKAYSGNEESQGESVGRQEEPGKAEPPEPYPSGPSEKDSGRAAKEDDPEEAGEAAASEVEEGVFSGEGEGDYFF